MRNAAVLLIAVASTMAVSAPAMAHRVAASLAASSGKALASPSGGSVPARVIGDGTAASCTSRAVVAAVAAGGLTR
jgi:hypothetical protein